MSRKTMAEQLRKGLRNEEAALDARFGKADEVMERFEQERTTLFAPSTAVPTPAAPKARAPAKKKAAASSATSDLVVREGFSMPQEERAIIDNLQAILRKQGLYEVTRSQIVRAAIATLSNFNPEQLLEAVGSIERRSPGPKTGAKEEIRNTSSTGKDINA
jgi:hypothetical protein